VRVFTKPPCTGIDQALGIVGLGCAVPGVHEPIV
jgi:hypothetical protein